MGLNRPFCFPAFNHTPSVLGCYSVVLLVSDKEHPPQMEFHGGRVPDGVKRKPSIQEFCKAINSLWLGFYIVIEFRKLVVIYENYLTFTSKSIDVIRWSS